MGDYRVYYFDSAGHICDSQVLTCADDAEAIMAFDERCFDRAMELWCLDRRLKSYVPANAQEILGELQD